MRDLVVREAVQEMARDAAKRFRELVAAGEEIPYDVRESGDGSPLPRYVPLTQRFVREHAPLLRELDSFGSACAALESAELAGPYLAESGVDAPPDGRRRAELAGVVFLARLWEDSTDFSLDEERLRVAISELEVNGDASGHEIEVVVPLRGLRMEATRLDLATATIVRADTVEVPAEARASEASGGAGWEPTFLAVTRVHADDPAHHGEDEEPRPDAGTRAVHAFRAMITTLRLFKSGGVALGPHAWTRLGGGRWRRISTGAGRPRPGGYRLAEGELPQLAAFSRTVAARSRSLEPSALPVPLSAAGLERAISRFEAGLERTAALDALNDYLLALRFVLEGGGPADLGLSMRVASLCADPDGRTEVKAVVDRALALERQLWSGEPPPAGEGHTPTETALSVEELARAILKDAACGHLGADLRVTADEILLADGLAVGDGAASQRGETAEWAAGSGDEEEIESQGDAEVEADAPRYGREAPIVEGELWLDGVEEQALEPQDGPVQVIRQPERITIERTGTAEEEEESMFVHAQQEAHEFEEPTDAMPEAGPPERPRRFAADGESPVNRLLALHSAEREATASRVANLFPKPETTEWNVREISYDRKRRARVDEAS